jgi:hypothetical protein
MLFAFGRHGQAGGATKASLKGSASGRLNSWDVTPNASPKLGPKIAELTQSLANP